MKQIFAHAFVAVCVAALAATVAAHDIETENLFGFTAGSSVDEPGEKGIELESGSRFGRRDGSYSAGRTKLAFGYTPVENFNFTLGLLADHYRIQDVTGLADQRHLDFGGVTAEFKLRLLELGKSPIGLTLSVEPTVGRFDADSGARAQSYSAEFKLIADAVLLHDRVFAAVNLFYEPEKVRERGATDWERSSTAGIAGAISVLVAKNVFLAGELRYARKYDSLGLDVFVGEALFAGPALFMKLSEKSWLQLAWSAQVAGRAVGDAGPLDLMNFNRHEARLKLGMGF
jgi:hypothetical protein